jgi:hypothetical protein
MSIEQSDTAILATFRSMEENIDYVLNDFWFAEMNRVRKEYDYARAEHKVEFIFSRKAEKLLLNGDKVFDFKDKTNLAFNLALTFAFAFDFACSCSALFTLAAALQHNGIEKLNKDTCEGKVVEIDGRKYKLTAV